MMALAINKSQKSSTADKWTDSSHIFIASCHVVGCNEVEVNSETVEWFRYPKDGRAAAATRQ